MKKLIGLAVLLAAFGMSAGIAGAQQTASQPLTLTVAAKLTITTTTLPAAVINTAYSASISYVGGTGPYSCTITSGALPAGLALGTATATSCPLSGTPTASGNFSFTVEVIDGPSGQRAHVAGSAIVPPTR